MPVSRLVEDMTGGIVMMVSVESVAVRVRVLGGLAEVYYTSPPPS